MIIRITLRDNDYTQNIENIFKHDIYFILKDELLKPYREDNTPEGLKMYFNLNEKIEDLVRKFRYAEQHSQDDKDKFLEFVKQAVENIICKQVMEVDYVKKNLEVSEVKYIEDEDENGEVVYYFTRQNKSITM